MAFCCIATPSVVLSSLVVVVVVVVGIRVVVVVAISEKRSQLKMLKKFTNWIVRQLSKTILWAIFSWQKLSRWKRSKEKRI